MPISPTGIWTRSRRQAGFTFVEVALTVGLLALMAGLVLPRINLAPSLSESSRRFIGAIQSLSIAATSSNRTYRLHLDLDQHLYWATIVTSEGERLPSDPSLAFRTALPSPVRFEDATVGRHPKSTVGQVVIEFYPGGTTDRAIIHLTNHADQRVSMLLNPLTGKVEISDRYFVEPPKIAPSEWYRQFFRALPPAPVSPSQPVQRPIQS